MHGYLSLRITQTHSRFITNALKWCSYTIQRVVLISRRSVAAHDGLAAETNHEIHREEGGGDAQTHSQQRRGIKKKTRLLLLARL